MIIRYYPDQETVNAAMQIDDPLLMCVSYDENTILISNIDDSFEHHILIKNLGYSELDIDKYFRTVVNQSGADWTFVCPTGYKGISNKDKRIEQFNNDGIAAITKAIKEIGYQCEINIPQRYRRHFNMLGE